MNGAAVDEQVVTRKATNDPLSEPVVLAVSDAPPIRTEALHIESTETMEFWDVTQVVRDVVERSGVTHGQVTVYSPHTTTTIVINESETGFLNDFRRVIDGLVPVGVYYEHDDHDVRTENLQEDEFKNGQAHVRQLLTGQPSVNVPIVDGEVLLGQWQRVLFVELDQARERRVFIHAQGS
jgi:secondary thiamine-phosphate synthase enzyme